ASRSTTCCRLCGLESNLAGGEARSSLHCNQIISYDPFVFPTFIDLSTGPPQFLRTLPATKADAPRIAPARTSQGLRCAPVRGVAKAAGVAGAPSLEQRKSRFPGHNPRRLFDQIPHHGETAP